MVKMTSTARKSLLSIDDSVRKFLRGVARLSLWDFLKLQTYEHKWKAFHNTKQYFSTCSS